MDIKNKPLFNLTVGELLDLIAEQNKEIIQQSYKNQNLDFYISKDQPDVDITNINWVCKISGFSKPTIYTKTSKGWIPCLSRGKPLLFSKNQIIMWIKANRPQTNDLKEIQKMIGRANE